MVVTRPLPILMAQLLAEGSGQGPLPGQGHSPWPLSPLLCLLDPSGQEDPEKGETVRGGPLGISGRLCEWGSVGVNGGLRR